MCWIHAFLLTEGMKILIFLVWVWGRLSEGQVEEEIFLVELQQIQGVEQDPPVIMELFAGGSEIGGWQEGENVKKEDWGERWEEKVVADNVQ